MYILYINPIVIQSKKNRQWSIDLSHVLSVTVRFFLPGFFFFGRTTLMGSTGESSGTSYPGNEVRRTGLAGLGDDIPTGGVICREFD